MMKDLTNVTWVIVNVCHITWIYMLTVKLLLLCTQERSTVWRMWWPVCVWVLVSFSSRSLIILCRPLLVLMVSYIFQSSSLVFVTVDNVHGYCDVLVYIVLLADQFVGLFLCSLCGAIFKSIRLLYLLPPPEKFLWMPWPQLLPVCNMIVLKFIISNCWFIPFPCLKTN